MVGEAATKMPKKDGGRAASGKGVKHATKDLLRNPETRGGKAAQEEHSRDNQPATPLPTSGRECSA